MATFDDDSEHIVSEFRFARDNSDTRFVDLRAVPAEIQALPNIKPGGVLMPLQQALVRDAQEDYLGKPQGALRARLDAFVNEADVGTSRDNKISFVVQQKGRDLFVSGRSNAS